MREFERTPLGILLRAASRREASGQILPYGTLHERGSQKSWIYLAGSVTHSHPGLFLLYWLHPNLLRLNLSGSNLLE